MFFTLNTGNIKYKELHHSNIIWLISAAIIPNKVVLSIVIIIFDFSYIKYTFEINLNSQIEW